ncbi:MAG: DUF167 domain-containing protein [Candidatus Aenigmatarchaeota archaeon]
MIVSIKAHPNSKNTRFLWKDNILHAYLTEPAKHNRANRQLVKELTKIFGPCRIVKGTGSKNKTVELPIKDKKELKAYLS